MDNVSIDEVDLMQYTKIKTAVHLNELGVWSFEFRVIERANDETRNVHELCLNIQDLRTVLQLGLNAMRRRAICKKSSGQPEEEIVTIIYCYKISWVNTSTEGSAWRHPQVT